VRQISQVAFHAEQAIHHNQLSGLFGQAFQYALEMFHIVMAVAFNFPITQPRTIDYAGMIVLIQNDNIIAADQGADRTQVGLHAG
jgi:hypothetical protein